MNWGKIQSVYNHIHAWSVALKEISSINKAEAVTAEWPPHFVRPQVVTVFSSE